MSLIKQIENSLESLPEEDNKKIDRKLSFTGKTKDMYFNVGKKKISENEYDDRNFADTEYNLRVNYRGNVRTIFIEDNQTIQDLKDNVKTIQKNINDDINKFINNSMTEKAFNNNLQSYFNKLLNEYNSVIKTLVDQYKTAKSTIEDIVKIHNGNFLELDKINMYNNELVGNGTFKHLVSIDMIQKKITTSNYYIKKNKKKTDQEIQTDDCSEQKKPEYIIDKTNDINIAKEKKGTKEKQIQTDKTENVQAEEKRVPIKIKGKQKKVVQKPKKKLNLCYLEFNHKENENLYSKQKVDDNKDLVKMQFERLGDKGWRNPSNLMLSVGKSPYRDDDKHYIGGKWN